MSETSIIKNVDELISTIDQDFDNFESLLDQIITDVVKNPKHVTSFISYINSKLSKSSSRRRGLPVLNAFIPLCPHNLCTENATAWINNALKYCERETVLQSTAYDVISQLLKVCIEIPELNKEVTSGILSKIIEQIKITSYNAPSIAHALRCLELCLRLYSGPCGPLKNAIEKYLITFVDCTSHENVRLAGKCLHALQQTGGGGTQGVNHKRNWKRQQEILCETIHMLMNELFESVVELNHVHEKDDIVPLNLPKLPVGEPLKLIARRIINVTIFLQEMLLGSFVTSKTVMPNIIIQTISRGLSITSSTIRNTIVAEAIYLSANLYLIHKYLLQLLQSLIVCLGTNLLPFAVRISKIIVNNLKYTSNKDTANVALYCELQIAIYRTLCLWMDTTKSANCVDELSQTLLPILTRDFSRMKNEISLMVQNSSTKPLSKKAKRKFQQDQIINSTMSQTYGPTPKKQATFTNVFEHKLCIEALIVVRSLLKNSGHLLKPVVHKQLQEFVVKTLLDIQRGVIVQPYDDSDCKLELYKTLTCLVYNHHFNITPPLSYAVLILSKGQSDVDPRISSFCTSEVANLNSFVHPTHATLQFPLDIETLADELLEEQEKEQLPPVISCIEITEMETETTETEPKNVDTVSATVQVQEHDKTDITLNENNTSNKNHNSDTSTIEAAKEVTDSEDIIEITPVQNTTPNKLEVSNNKKDIEKVYRTPNKSSFSVQIEILSDDEVMEQLTINDEPDTSEAPTTDKEDCTSNGQGKGKLVDDNIINLEEEEMCSAFVNIVNE